MAAEARPQLRVIRVGQILAPGFSTGFSSLVQVLARRAFESGHGRRLERPGTPGRARAKPWKEASPSKEPPQGAIERCGRPLNRP